ncbi:unnamed protein product [Penicillium salamii]|uniref:Uncharacterized protein n=1 Tax=Penicillium salamii TaxID=1612424 RepID=A0A9W4NA40_9EURO|nr:unnamed protein product [Penicillium salamii]
MHAVKISKSCIFGTFYGRTLAVPRSLSKIYLCVTVQRKAGCVNIRPQYTQVFPRTRAVEHVCILGF